MKNKSVGFYLAAITCALSVVTLILLLVYGSRGGFYYNIVLQPPDMYIYLLSLFFP